MAKRKLWVNIAVNLSPPCVSVSLFLSLSRKRTFGPLSREIKRDIYFIKSVMPIPLFRYYVPLFFLVMVYNNKIINVEYLKAFNGVQNLNY